MWVPQTQPGVGGPCAWGGDPQGAQRAFTVSTTSVLSGELAGSCSSFSCDEGRCDGIYARSWAQRNVASGVLKPETVPASANLEARFLHVFCSHLDLRGRAEPCHPEASVTRRESRPQRSRGHFRSEPRPQRPEPRLRYLTFPPAFCILIRSSYCVGLCSLLRLKAACFWLSSL